MINIRRLFVPCIVCGEETRFLDMFCCLNCDEPICRGCLRQDGFCSDECCDAFHKQDDDQ